MTADSAEAPQSPLVSIGVPVLNEYKAIGAHIERLLQQSYHPLVIVVSENCSTVGTRDLVRAIASESLEVKVISQTERIGIIANFWTTLENSTGEYFMWAQPDDERDSDFITRAVARLESAPVAVSAMAPDIFASKHGADTEPISRSRYRGMEHLCARRKSVLAGGVVHEVRTEVIRRLRRTTSQRFSRPLSWATRSLARSLIPALSRSLQHWARWMPVEGP